MTTETAPPDEALFSLFEDLLEDTSVSSSDQPLAGEDERDDDEPLVHKLDANALTLNELVQELEKRGLQARGFFADDAKVLQEKFDEEHELYVEAKRREKREAREADAKRAAEQRRRLLMETEVREEREEIGRDRRMKSWLLLTEEGMAPPHSRIEVNNISARSLAKALLTDSSILCLDVSNLGLSDLAGAYLCRALRSNRTLIKIELGSNKFGPKTCKSLGDALTSNNVVRFVSLESNPLTGEKNDISGIIAIAEMLSKNKALRYLSLWRCGTGADSGKAIADAMAFNDALTCIEVGYNGWENSHTSHVAAKLVREVISRQPLQLFFP
uniref:Tropomodulin n=1 Tax=Pseudictyota dubia TaxID=2749911 RepID=A0A7R9VZE3_9STRA|mmetsp:Transcript_26149/g.48714  ORF Transcript_26149/g.48714 Transcript_26149/m.48714 type:complete len:329 (+) Transcript_26149:211-1197(+)